MKLTKVLSVVTVVFMLLVSCSNFVYASNAVIPSVTVNPGDINVEIPKGSDEIQTFGGKIVGLIQIIGSVIAIAIIALLGIKYMMGSAEEKAEYKKTLVPYLVGAILIFAASNISGMVYNAVKDL